VEGSNLLLQQNRELSPWLKTDQQIEQWLKQRQAVLITYHQLCQTKISTSNFKLSTLNTFCQYLMDYLSAGHFKIYETLAEAYQTSEGPNQGINDKLLEKILLTTDIALDFNDKYTEPKNLQELPEDLSTLGENLAHRMEWEDKLVNTYLKITKH